MRCWRNHWMAFLFLSLPHPALPWHGGPVSVSPGVVPTSPTAGMSCEPSPNCALLLRSFARAVRGRVVCLCFTLFCSASLFFAKFGVCSALLRSAACAPAWDWFYLPCHVWICVALLLERRFPRQRHLHTEAAR